MTRETEILFLLLREGLETRRPEDGERAAALFESKPDWATVCALASAQGVLSVAWDGLQHLTAGGRLPADCRPDHAQKMQWAYSVDRMERCYARQSSVLGKLAGFYAGHGIRMLLLKGCGLSLNYPVPAHRPCGDIDIWLFGKQREADAFLRAEKGIGIDEGKHHHTVFQVNGVMVENHYDFLNVHSHASNREIEHRLRALAAEEGETICLSGEKIFLPSPDFNALFLLRHAAVHFAAVKMGLRQVLDWALFVQRYHTRIDWPQLERIAREQNMTRFLNCMNALSIDCLGISPDCFPPFERDRALEARVLHDIFYPRLAEAAPGGGIAGVLIHKCRRWWANRWKHRMVYREGLLRTFFVQLYSHLLKPDSLKS